MPCYWQYNRKRKHPATIEVRQLHAVHPESFDLVRKFWAEQRVGLGLGSALLTTRDGRLGNGAAKAQSKKGLRPICPMLIDPRLILN